MKNVNDTSELRGIDPSASGISGLDLIIFLPTGASAGAPITREVGHLIDALLLFRDGRDQSGVTAF